MPASLIAWTWSLIILRNGDATTIPLLFSVVWVSLPPTTAKLNFPQNSWEEPPQGHTITWHPFTTRHHPYDVIWQVFWHENLIDRSHDLLLHADWSICTTWPISGFLIGRARSGPLYYCEVTSRPFSLSRLPLRPNFHGERVVWVRGRILTVPNSACKRKSATCCNFRGSCLLSIKLKLKNPGSSTKSALNRPRSVKSVKLNQ